MMKPCCVLSSRRKEQLDLDAHQRLPGLAPSHELGNKAFLAGDKGSASWARGVRRVWESTTPGQSALPGAWRGPVRVGGKRTPSWEPGGLDSDPLLHQFLPG